MIVPRFIYHDYSTFVITLFTNIYHVSGLTFPFNVAFAVLMLSISILSLRSVSTIHEPSDALAFD